MFSIDAIAQYNTITGTVWLEADGTPNGIRNGGESLVTGILASLIDVTTGLEVASSISNTSGEFTLNNYTGAGTYRIDYSYPSDGYTIAAMRSGADNTINSAADPANASNNVVPTPDFVISSTANLNTYGLGLVRITNTITYYISKPSTPTDWSQTFTLPKSDDIAYGITNRAVIFATNSSFYPLLGLENTSTTSATNATISSNGNLSLTLPTLPSLQINANAATKNATLDIYDGTTDYAGTSGVSFTNESGSGINLRAYNSTLDLMNYFRSAGPATFDIPALVKRSTTFTGGGNLQAISQANSAAGLFVIYRYSTAVVPIALISFTATKNGETSRLQWKVSAQQSKVDFKIERSKDGRDFTEIGSVPSVNNTVDQSYQFVDTKPQAGTNIYRLKQVEITGQKNYSSSAIVIFGKVIGVVVYPNPANASIIVNSDAASKILLYNSLGQAVNLQVKRNGNQAVLNTTKLAPGNYVLQVLEDGVSKAQQIIIKH